MSDMGTDIKHSGRWAVWRNKGTRNTHVTVLCALDAADLYALADALRDASHQAGRVTGDKP